MNWIQTFSEDGNSFSKTGYFDAAWDAEKGKAWPRDKQGTFNQKRFATQVRQLHRASQLLAVDPTLDNRFCERVGHELGVPGLLLHEERLRVKESPLFQVTGRAVTRVLRTLWRAPQMLYQRLLVSGYLNGIWGRPQLYKYRADYLWVLGPEQPRAGPENVT